MFLKSRRIIKPAKVQDKRLSRKELKAIDRRLKELGYSSKEEKVKKDDIPSHIKIDFINSYHEGAYAAMDILKRNGTPFELSKTELKAIEKYEQEERLKEIEQQ